MIPDIPPKWVIRAARTALDRKGASYINYYDVLCAYYEIDNVNAVVNKDRCLKLGDNTIACFVREDNRSTIFSKENTMRESTALHEFFHHLVNQKLIKIKKRAEEGLADAFANECLGDDDGV